MRSSSASTRSSSSLPDSIRSFSPCTVAISSSASPSPGLLGLADLLGEGLALGLGALDLGQQLAAAGVEGEQLVDLLGGAAAGQRRLDPLGVGADQLQVEHVASALGRVSPGRGEDSASSPAYLATKRATASASSPTTMFWGMIAPEKPPFWIA